MHLGILHKVQAGNTEPLVARAPNGASAPATCLPVPLAANGVERVWKQAGHAIVEVLVAAGANPVHEEPRLVCIEHGAPAARSPHALEVVQLDTAIVAWDALRHRDAGHVEAPYQ